MSPSSQLSSLLFPGSYQSAQHMDVYELKDKLPAHPCAWRASPHPCSRLQGARCHRPVTSDQP